jgi:hypothetical protein
MDFTTLSLADTRTALDETVGDTRATFAGLSARQLNWRPDAAQWSVAQCFEHLLTANRLMLEAANDALGAGGPTLWQRVPVLPGLFGRALIRSQAPDGQRKFTAPSKARPTVSDVGADIVQRFIDQQRHIMTWVQGLDEQRAARTVMTSPFARVVVYSVLDGCRIVVAHNRRHVEQARRVMQAPGFPRGPASGASTLVVAGTRRGAPPTSPSSAARTPDTPRGR